LLSLYSFIAGLHVLGWGLFVHAAATTSNLAYAGAGTVAYCLGLRHAFDADHIAAIDDTTRLLLRRGRLPLAVGFFFSLGHASVVLALSVVVALAAQGAEAHFAVLRELGSVIGTWISGTFLALVVVLNAVVLLYLVRAARSPHDRPAASGSAPVGVLSRLLDRSTRRWVSREWHLWGVGLLFGLGFDTASEIGLLGLTASTTTPAGLSAGAVLALPLLFAAGMCLLDTTDGVLMARAYAWALGGSQRRVRYNIATTALSAAAALSIGGAELGAAALRQLGIEGAGSEALAWLGDRSTTLGVSLCVTFAILWLAARGTLKRATPVRSNARG
jgi:high-affinity nickel-transport protein